MEAEMNRSGAPRAAATLAVGASLLAAPALAASVKVPMTLVTAQGTGASVGDVTLADGPKGVTLAVDLHGLPPGQHGFHLHANPSCAPGAGADGKVVAAGAAGAHLDPGHTNMHMGPEGAGHLGDLPRIDVGADGTARESLTAPRIKSVAEFSGHALMIHAGGDTYSDTPPLGGGGARLACGVIP
jgi:Cu-Zn family superoxide dismutase